MEATLNIKRSPDVPAWQRKAWGEFLEMLLERAELDLRKEDAGPASGLTGPAEGGENRD